MVSVWCKTKALWGDCGNKKLGGFRHGFTLYDLLPLAIKPALCYCSPKAVFV
jgi:hypothetical protein